eukprot:TRINITY_DN12247_c0_g3_i1.p1 TRINITY_DN12247_c0_g3~~TRINITY_DN12247_c0_g3_i1.p1  ORF type:complete len:141 (+),score=45.70 TRINITY_DN12247_c0_g3_i1:119-541(+)
MVAMGADLGEIAARYNLGDDVLALMCQKNVTSASSVAKIFEDEDQFVDFLIGDADGMLRVKMALKMIYFDAIQRSRESGEAPRVSDSPASVSEAEEEEVPAPSDPEDDDEDEEEYEEEECAPAPAPPPAPPAPEGPRWNY